MENKKNIRFLEGAAIGAVIGSIGALLFAQKSGKELRDDITEHTSDFFKAIAPKLRRMKEVTQDEFDEFIEEAADKFAEMKKLSKHQVAQLIAHAKESWHSLHTQTEDDE